VNSRNEMPRSSGLSRRGVWRRGPLPLTLPYRMACHGLDAYLKDQRYVGAVVSSMVVIWLSMIRAVPFRSWRYGWSGLNGWALLAIRCPSACLMA